MAPKMTPKDVATHFNPYYHILKNEKICFFEFRSYLHFLVYFASVFGILCTYFVRPMDISPHRDHIWNMAIPPIWEVTQGLVNLFSTSDQPPDTFCRKKRASKNSFFTEFSYLTKAALMACKVNNKKSHPQVKKYGEIFFTHSISVSSYPILISTK